MIEPVPDFYWVGVPLRSEMRKRVDDAVERRIAADPRWRIQDQLVEYIIMGIDCERSH